MPPPPPVTPSPHRFVARRDKKKAPSQAISRLSAAHAPTPQSRALTPAQQDVTPSQQFNPTPRFSIAPSRPSFSSLLPSTPHTTRPNTLSRADHITDGADTPSVSRYPRPRLSKVESIHDDFQEDSEDGAGQDGEEMLYDAVTEEDTLLVERPDEDFSCAQEEQTAPPSDFMLVAPRNMEDQPSKRRRLTPGPHLTPERSTRAAEPVKMDAGAPILDSPSQSSKIPRFRAPGYGPAFPTIATDPALSQPIGSRHRNPFLLRSAKADVAGSVSGAAITPLPEHFSPHRRSQKFLPGGMADVVRAWVLSVGQSGFQTETTSNQSGQRAGQPSKFHVTGSVEERPGDRLKLVSVRESTHSRPSLVQGEAGSTARAMLVGPAKGNSRSPNVGDEVTVLSPNWDVQVGQSKENWLVAVDWRLT